MLPLMLKPLSRLRLKRRRHSRLLGPLVGLDGSARSVGDNDKAWRAFADCAAACYEHTAFNELYALKVFWVGLV